SGSARTTCAWIRTWRPTPTPSVKSAGGLRICPSPRRPLRPYGRPWARAHSALTTAKSFTGACAHSVVKRSVPRTAGKGGKRDGKEGTSTVGKDGNVSESDYDGRPGESAGHRDPGCRVPWRLSGFRLRDGPSHGTGRPGGGGRQRRNHLDADRREGGPGARPPHAPGRVPAQRHPRPAVARPLRRSVQVGTRDQPAG